MVVVGVFVVVVVAFAGVVTVGVGVRLISTGVCVVSGISVGAFGVGTTEGDCSSVVDEVAGSVARGVLLTSKFFSYERSTGSTINSTLKPIEVFLVSFSLTSGTWPAIF